jgi:hypothetical protein
MQYPITPATVISTVRLLFSFRQGQHEKRKRRRAFRDFIAVTLSKVDYCTTAEDLLRLHHETAHRLKDETARVREDIAVKHRFKLKLACDAFCNANHNEIQGFSPGGFIHLLYPDSKVAVNERAWDASRGRMKMRQLLQPLSDLAQ